MFHSIDSHSLAIVVGGANTTEGGVQVSTPGGVTASGNLKTSTDLPQTPSPSVTERNQCLAQVGAQARFWESSSTTAANQLAVCGPPPAR